MNYLSHYFSYCCYCILYDLNISIYWEYFLLAATISAKRFTDEPAPGGGRLQKTLQIFSVKVTGLRGGLQFPLDVYGMVATRDRLDHNRNIIFNRKRDNCQTLTQEVSSILFVSCYMLITTEDLPLQILFLHTK